MHFPSGQKMEFYITQQIIFYFVSFACLFSCCHKSRLYLQTPLDSKGFKWKTITCTSENWTYLKKQEMRQYLQNMSSEEIKNTIFNFHFYVVPSGEYRESIKKIKHFLSTISTLCKGIVSVPFSRNIQTTLQSLRLTKLRENFVDNSGINHQPTINHPYLIALQGCFQLRTQEDVYNDINSFSKFLTKTFSAKFPQWNHDVSSIVADKTLGNPYNC